MKRLYVKVKSVLIKVKDKIKNWFSRRKQSTPPIDEHPITKIIQDLNADGKIKFEPGQTAPNPQQFSAIMDQLLGGTPLFKPFMP